MTANGGQQCRENDAGDHCIGCIRWETHDFEVYGEGVKAVIRKVMGHKGLADAGIDESERVWVLEAPWKPFFENWDEFIKASEAGGEEGEAAGALVRAMEPALEKMAAAKEVKMR